MSEKPHKKLKLWDEIMKLIEDIYLITSKFPKEEVYGLSLQMRRAAISIASNVAEGCARKGDKEKIQFFMISRGSVSELDAQIEIALRLSFINQEEYINTNNKLQQVSRMLHGLIKSRQNEK